MAQLRSLATVSGFTAISRVLGFLRDLLIAHFVGLNHISDAFFTAFRFPNMFRRIFGEGAFNAAFVPLFAKKLEHQGKEKALHFGSHTFSMLAVVLMIGTIIAIPCMSLIMSLVAPGFKARFESEIVHVSETVNAEDRGFKIKGAKAIYFQTARASEDDPKNVGVPRVNFEGSILVAKDGTRKELRAVAVDVPEVLTSVPGVASFQLPPKHPYVQCIPKAEIAWRHGGAAADQNTPFRFQGFTNHPNTFPLTVTLARITFIYLLCMALAAHLSGVLNTVKIFGMPAAAPIFLNVIFIIGLVLVVPMTGRGGHVLAWCVFLAGFVQLGLLWWSCRKHGFPVKLVKPKMSPEMKRLFILMGPGILSAGIQQVNLFVGGIIASLQESAVSYLYYSERIYQLPLGMVGIAFGVVLLPDITRKLRSNQDLAAQDSMNRGIEYALLISIPATVALLVIAFPIIAGIFESPKFTRADSLATAPALAAFALGLPGYVLIKVLQPGYFAREDTKTPMKFAAITVLANIVLSLIFFWALRSKGVGHVGIALATSLAAWVNVALLAIGLKKERFLKLDQRLLDKLWRIGICSLLMGILLFALRSSLDGYLKSGRWACLLSLAILVGVGLLSYATSALTLGATTVKELKAGFRRQ